MLIRNISSKNSNNISAQKSNRKNTHILITCKVSSVPYLKNQLASFDDKIKASVNYLWCNLDCFYNIINIRSYIICNEPSQNYKK